MITVKYLAAPAALLVLGLGLGAARAQYNPVPPSAVPQAPPQMGAGAGPAVAQPPGYVAPVYPPGYPGYAYYPPMDPNYGYLSGAANVIGAQGQFAKDIEQSKLIKEQVKQAQLDTRRKANDQWRYEKALEPTLAEIQAKAQFDTYQQMRGKPSDGAVWSGQAQNVLLANIQRGGPLPAGAGPSIPLDPDVVRQIILTDGRNGGQLAKFAESPKLEWPLALRAPDFQPSRDAVQTMYDTALKQVATTGQAGFETIQGLQRAVSGMQADLKGQIDSLTPDDYMQSKRFLADLGRAARGLGEPSAAQVVAGKWKPQASTVGQLVAQMTQQGLRFAPGREGSEAAYTALYQALRAYDGALGQMAYRPGGPAGPGGPPPGGPQGRP